MGLIRKTNESEAKLNLSKCYCKIEKKNYVPFLQNRRKCSSMSLENVSP